MRAKRAIPLKEQWRGYSPGHPWYYILGGDIPFPSDIKALVIKREYKGYMAERIAKADGMIEPKRSESLRNLKRDALADLKSDLSAYRRYAHELRALRRSQDIETPPSCEDIHVAVSLKHNHAYNGFAHLMVIDKLLSKQGDLFA